MAGTGKLVWENGDVYEGEFENGKYNGYGTMKYEDGSIASGNWQKGRKHGFFTETDTEGQQNEIEWYMGKRAKPLIEYKKRMAKRERTSEDSQT